MAALLVFLFGDLYHLPMMKPLRAERLAYKTIGTETIILDSKGHQEVHQLNEVAGFIWNLCDGTNDINAMTEKLCHEFEVEKEVALSDVQSLLEDFSSKALLEPDRES